MKIKQDASAVRAKLERALEDCFFDLYGAAGSSGMIDPKWSIRTMTRELRKLVDSLQVMDDAMVNPPGCEHGGSISRGLDAIYTAEKYLGKR